MFQRIFSDTDSSNIEQISVMNSGDVLISYKSNPSKLYHFQTQNVVELVSQIQAMQFPENSIGKKIHQWKSDQFLTEVTVQTVGINTTVTF